MEMECPKCWKIINIPNEIIYNRGYFVCPYCHTDLYYEYDECCDDNYNDCYSCAILEIKENNDRD